MEQEEVRLLSVNDSDTEDNNRMRAVIPLIFSSPGSRFYCLLIFTTLNLLAA